MGIEGILARSKGDAGWRPPHSERCKHSALSRGPRAGAFVDRIQDPLSLPIAPSVQLSPPPEGLGFFGGPFFMLQQQHIYVVMTT